MSKSRILSLLSQYELLEQIAGQLSALDLLNLALACSEVHRIVCGSGPVFERLKRVTLCDGRGLKARQEFQSLHAPIYHYYDDKGDPVKHGGKGRRAMYDEEIEVRIYNRKCDAANALPCLKCGVNVCEECRYMPRVRDDGDQSRRRPHLDAAYQSRDTICYCSACDANVERDLQLSLSEYCDCDQYTRWICMPCKVRENQADKKYYEMSTKNVWFAENLEEGMVIPDHQSDRAFWCPCGERAPTDGNVRCAWCRRRHNLRNWMSESPNRIPYFDDDPYFPRDEWISM